MVPCESMNRKKSPCVSDYHARLLRRMQKWCCTIKVDTGNLKSQYIEKEKQEARRDGSESTKIQHGI